MGPWLFGLAGLSPAFWMAWRAYSGLLPLADPVGAVLKFSGLWAIRWLLVSLAVTPAARLSGQSKLMRYRRAAGLVCFFYALCHASTWIVLDQELDVYAMGREIAKRLWITVGMATFLLLLSLALTSTDGAIRRLGRWWSRLHSLIYLAAPLACLHFYWSQKKDKAGPYEYAAVLAALLGYRAFRAWSSRAQT